MVTPASRASACTDRTESSMIGCSRVRFGDTIISPASIFDMSRMSLTMRIRRSALERATRTS